MDSQYMVKTNTSQDSKVQFIDTKQHEYKHTPVIQPSKEALIMPTSPLNLIVENTKSKFDENGNKLTNVRKIRSKKYLAYGEKSIRGGSSRPHSV
tara:strand:- start:747 stop:1031 length:285 start_codon:yes stop_codon:yes gene_type:complete